jgi:excisionase family DNA binding protein
VRFLSVAGAAEVLGMSQVTLYRAIHARQFPAVKVRGRYVIPARVLDAIEDAVLSTGTVVDAADWSDGVGPP